MVLVIHGGRVMGFWWGHGVPSRRVVVWGGGEILIKTYPGTNLCPPLTPSNTPFSLFLLLSFSLSLSLSFSLARSLARSLGLPSLTHTFLPSSPSRYTRPSVASGSQCRIRNGKRFSLANQTNHFYVLAGDVSHERCCRCIEIM